MCQRRQNSATDLAKYGRLKLIIRSYPRIRAVLKPTIEIRRTQALTFAGRFSEAVELGFDLLERIADGVAPDINPLDHVTLHTIVGDALNELGRPNDGKRRREVHGDGVVPLVFGGHVGGL